MNFEIGVLAACTLDTSLSLQAPTLTREGAAVKDAITALKFKTATIEMVADSLASLDLTVPRSYLESVFLQAQSVPPTHIEDFYAFCAKALNGNARRAKMKETLRKAQLLLDKGKEAESLLTLERVTYTGDEDELMHTVAGMQRSLFSDSTFRTGISAIDKETGGFRLGNIMTIAGDTGSMKTMSSMWLILQMLKENPTFKALYFEKEMPSKDVYRRLVCMFGNITEKDLSEIPVNDALKMLKDISERSEVAALLSRFFVVDTNNFDTVADMYKYILLHKPTIWCLDYLTQLHGSGNTTDVASKVRNDINDLKRIVHRTGTFGIVLCQLNKNTVEQRRDKRPIMDDIEWSSDIKKLSAYVFSTFFPYKYYANEEIRRYYYLISLKNRFNSLFTLALTAIPEYSTFSHPPQDELLEYKRFYEGYESGRITQ